MEILGIILWDKNPARVELEHPKCFQLPLHTLGQVLWCLCPACPGRGPPASPSSAASGTPRSWGSVSCGKIPNLLVSRGKKKKKKEGGGRGKAGKKKKQRRVVRQGGDLLKMAQIHPQPGLNWVLFGFLHLEMYFLLQEKGTQRVIPQKKFLKKNIPLKKKSFKKIL